MCTFSNRKNVKEPELVYASEANVQIPQMVIKFYESKLTWHDVSEDCKHKLDSTSVKL